MKVEADPSRCLASQCDFCREGCASYLAFDLDSFSSRGKNRILAAYQSGRLKQSDLVDIAFKCSSCGQCSEVCITGDGIYQGVPEIREKLAGEGLTPVPLKQLSARIEKTGSAFEKKDTSWFGGREMKSDIGYFPGCGVLAFNPELASKTLELLASFGMKTVPVTDLCCSSPLYRGGLVGESRKIAEKLQRVLKKKRIKTLVCSCPGCALTLKEVYPTLIKGWKPRVLHISEVLAGKVREGKVKIKGKRLMYHDPCHLARGLGITTEPRYVLRSLGHEVMDFDRKGKSSVCCGSGGSLALLYPEEAKSVARVKVDEALEVKAELLVTFCPLCQRALSNAAGRDILVKDVVEML